jgi:hypothetical protein
LLLVSLLVAALVPALVTPHLLTPGVAYTQAMNYERRRGAGGTPGGLGEFIAGALLACVGAYLLLSRVTVTTGFWSFGGMNHPFGVMLVPLIAGIAVLFANGKSILGWALTGGTLIAILLGVLLNMNIYFQQTSLVVVLVMVATLGAGIGLVFRSVRPHGE